MLSASQWHRGHAGAVLQHNHVPASCPLHIIELFDLEGTLRGHLIQLPCSDQGHMQFKQVATQIFICSLDARSHTGKYSVYIQDRCDESSPPIWAALSPKMIFSKMYLNYAEVLIGIAGVRGPCCSTRKGRESFLPNRQHRVC